MANRIQINQGNTLDIKWTCTDSDGSVVDLTGATVVMKVYNESTLVESKTVTSHSDPTAGETIISFTAAQTNDWPLNLLDYEIEVTLADGKVFTGLTEYIQVSVNL